MPKLRGHHLICLHFYHGEGYDEGFVRNLESVMSLLRGEGVTIAHGADDVCRGCLHLKDDACGYAEGADEEIRGMDAAALNLLGVASGSRHVWDEIGKCLPGIFRQWYESYCVGCGWRRACEKDEYYRELAGGKNNRKMTA